MWLLVLVLGIFDAVNDDSITLQSGRVLSRGSLVNPVCIVANYLFDTLYHDIFQVHGSGGGTGVGVLKEGLVSTGSKHAHEPDPLHPDIITRLKNLYQYVPTHVDYYSDQLPPEESLHYRRMLQWYLDCFGRNPAGASLLIPTGALRALRVLTAFSDRRCIVISGDKGNNNPEQFVGIMDPHIAGDGGTGGKGREGEGHSTPLCLSMYHITSEYDLPTAPPLPPLPPLPQCTGPSR